jgi:hypothetical protein
MTPEEFRASIKEEAPPSGLSVALAALWWDVKGDWTRAHALVDELESRDGMAVDAYLHHKEGRASNAEYWYQRAGRTYHRPTLDAEREALIEGLLSGAGKRELSLLCFCPASLLRHRNSLATCSRYLAATGWFGAALCSLLKSVDQVFYFRQLRHQGVVPLAKCLFEFVDEIHIFSWVCA